MVEVSSKKSPRRFILIHPVDRRCLSLDVKDHFVWEQLDGSLNIGQIKQAYYQKFKVLPTQHIMEEVRHWHEEGFLQQQPDKWQALKARLPGWWGIRLPGLMIRPILGPFCAILVSSILFWLLTVASLGVFGAALFLEGPLYLHLPLDTLTTPWLALSLMVGFYSCGLWRFLVRLGGLWKGHAYRGDRWIIGAWWIFPGVGLGDGGLILKSREVRLAIRAMEWIGSLFLGAVFTALYLWVPLPESFTDLALGCSLGAVLDFLLRSCPFLQGTWIRLLDAFSENLGSRALRAAQRSDPDHFENRYGSTAVKVVQAAVASILLWVVMGSTFLLFTASRAVEVLGRWGQLAMDLGEASGKFWQFGLYTPVMLAFFWMLWKLVEPFVESLLNSPLLREERMLVPTLCLVTLSIPPLSMVLPDLLMQVGLGVLCVALLVLMWRAGEEGLPLAQQARLPLLLILLTSSGSIFLPQFSEPFRLATSLMALLWAAWGAWCLSPMAPLWYARVLGVALPVVGAVLWLTGGTLPGIFLGVAAGLWVGLAVWSCAGAVGVQALPSALGGLLLIFAELNPEWLPVDPAIWRICAWALLVQTPMGWSRAMNSAATQIPHGIILVDGNPRKGFLDTLSRLFSGVMGPLAVGDARKAHKAQPRFIACLDRWSSPWMNDETWDEIVRMGFNAIPWGVRHAFEKELGGGILSEREGPKGLTLDQRSRVLRSQLCFKGFKTEEVALLVDHMEIMEAPAGTVLVEQGAQGRPFLEIVLQGSVALERHIEGSARRSVLAELGKLEAVRLEDLFEDKDYDFSMRCTADVVTARVYRTHLLAWSREFEGGMAKVLESLNLAGMIMKLSLFRDFSPAQVRLVMEKLKKKEVGPGVDVITQGTEGDEFYLLDQGGVDIVVGENKVAELGAGSYFGEIALLDKCLRTATVRTNRPSLLYSLVQQDFDRFFAAGRGAQVLQNVSSQRGGES